MSKKEVVIYTDGGASPNPGKGGYGVVMQCGSHYKELSEGFELTTNNRMELLSVIKALENLKRSDLPVKIYSDSKYLVDAINKKWLEKWEQKNYSKTKNKDLWIRIKSLIRKYNCQFFWVKGHSGVSANERCDQLVGEAMRSSNLSKDEEYSREMINA